MFFGPRRSDRLWDGAFRDEMLTFRSFTGQHVDGMIGPLYRARIRVRGRNDILLLEAEEAVSPMPGGLTLTVSLDGRELATHSPNGQRIRLSVPLVDVPPGECEVEIRSSSYVTSFELTGERDFRPLSLRLIRLEACNSAQSVAA